MAENDKAGKFARPNKNLFHDPGTVLVISALERRDDPGSPRMIATNPPARGTAAFVPKDYYVKLLVPGEVSFGSKRGSTQGRQAYLGMQQSLPGAGQEGGPSIHHGEHGRHQ